MTTSKAPRQAEFFIAPNFQGKGPRVLVLVGPSWTPTMRRHYGATGKPFYSRQALSIEPDTDVRKHPWGWVYKPSDLLLEEARWSTPETMRLLKSQLSAALEALTALESHA